MATRYPKFASASIVAPRSFGAFFFTPECDVPPQIFPDNPNNTGLRASGRLERYLRSKDKGRVKAVLHILSSDIGNSTGLDLEVEGQCVSETAAVLNTCIELLQAGLSIAFVVVLQTLISASIAAKTTKVKCNYRKEVK